MIPTTDDPIGDTPALIVVDPQQTTPESEEAMSSGAGSISGGRDAVMENINTVVKCARDADIPVIWGKEIHRSDFADYGAEIESCEPAHGIVDSCAEQFDPILSIDEDAMEPAEYIIEKRRYNFFHRTEIEHLLRTYDIDTVILVGFMTNICVHYTAHGAHEHDYAFRVAKEATAAPSQDLHEMGLKCMRYLQPRGVRNIDAITNRLVEYDGNEIVKKVKRTGQVTTKTGPVSANNN
ncbi:cysteine hydrolase family protein [Haloquadratum walsbyi]|jgi:Amidases related to nicotinamidase|uniref:Nicotinamidase-like amidase n=1 Tax=Haloquadratum walsbyi J07HQW2 TaxID=1238425 RepID=U1PUE8_9EURY|nr:isochorismatase family cysteine hydrolase [Haloquadratum walsbyi]ERG95996.1 MAG: nicotinamidase-like amidase [Haloquadratum walsbyi J07HQW2]